MKTGNSLYNVKTKGALFNLKINPAVRDEFKAACDVLGSTMSSLIHRFIFQTIREVKRDMPEEFEERLAEIMAEKHTSPANNIPQKPFIPGTPSGHITASTRDQSKKGGSK